MNNELAYVLHTRKYRETSQLVDLFSRNEGRFRVVARGSRTKKNPRITLQPFRPLLASWRGKSDLKTLTDYEYVGSSELPQGKALYIGFYINELLTRLLAEYIPHQNLFDQYARLVTILGHSTALEPELRIFELSLLDEMGYGLNLYADSLDGSGLDLHCDYLFRPGEGFSKVDNNTGQVRQNIYSGAHLLAIAEHRFDNEFVLQSAKRLMRAALALHLGARPLHSRELFKQATSIYGKTS